MNKIFISKSKIQGNGIFAKVNIRKNSIIDICPVLIFSAKDANIIENTSIGSYHYQWTRGKYVLALGFGSLFNHSYDANCQYEMQYKEKTIRFIACKNIKKGEEVFINYNGDPDCKKKVWFDQ